jgi:hypothetical protein
MLEPWSNPSTETRIANEKTISLPPLHSVVRMRAAVSFSRFREAPIIAEEIRTDR